MLSAMLVVGATSCKDEITIGETVVPGATAGIPALYVATEDGSTGDTTVEIHNSGSVNFKVKTAEPQATSTNLKLAYDAA